MYPSQPHLWRTRESNQVTKPHTLTIQAGVEANHAQATAKLFSTQAKPKVGRAGATHRHSPHIRSTGYCGYYSRNPRIVSARKPQHGLITILSWQPGQEVTQFVGF